MALKLNRQSETYWETIEGGQFLLRPLTLTEENKLRKENTKTDRRGVENTNQHKLLMDKFDRIVEDWRDIEINGDSNPDCTRGNKVWVVDNFTSLAADVINKSEEVGYEATESDNTNLKQSSHGKSKEAPPAQSAKRSTNE